jgi:DNA integrity scanning protein DisA with diadenylate cyclase activity
MAAKKKKQARRASGRAHPAPTTAECITKSLVDSISSIAKICRAEAIFVYEDALAEGRLPLPDTLRSKVIYVTKTQDEEEEKPVNRGTVLKVPNVVLSRIGQVKIAIFLALSRGLIHQGDVVVFLSGLAASSTLDTLFVTEVGRELEFVAASDEALELPADIRPEVLDRVIHLSAELGSEGREGKSVGALFVMGDTENVAFLSRQLILNPFRGYPEKERNILDPQLEETIKELATIDGAFLIRGDGIIETCGAFLKTASQEEYELPRGLGSRHHAAAAITAVTESLAITVSQSTGTVTVFQGGKVIVTIDKPYRTGEPKKPA